MFIVMPQNQSITSTETMRFTAAITFAALLSQASAFGVNGPSNNSHRVKTELNVDVSALQSTDPTILGAAGAAVAGILGFLAKSQGDSGATTTAAVAEPEPEPIDVSIPYDAAARLAFEAAKLPASKYAEFLPLYEAKTVADVTVKKFARDLKEMEADAAEKAKALEALS